jgi:hypothetical protein
MLRGTFTRVALTAALASELAVPGHARDRRCYAGVMRSSLREAEKHGARSRRRAGGSAAMGNRHRDRA